jgi:hypothetical protein
MLDDKIRNPMKTRNGNGLPTVARHWRSTRPLPWRLRSMINQRRRSSKR